MHQDQDSGADSHPPEDVVRHKLCAYAAKLESKGFSESSIREQLGLRCLKFRSEFERELRQTSMILLLSSLLFFGLFVGACVADSFQWLCGLGALASSCIFTLAMGDRIGCMKKLDVVSTFVADYTPSVTNDDHH